MIFRQIGSCLGTGKKHGKIVRKQRLTLIKIEKNTASKCHIFIHNEITSISKNCVLTKIL